MYSCNAGLKIVLTQYPLQQIPIKEILMKDIYSLDDLREFIRCNPVVVVYFSNESCSVCKVLKPKIIELMNESFSLAKLVYVDTEKSPLITGQFRVFTIPTIDIYAEGREHVRFSRNVTLHEFERTLKKPYEILFSE